MTGRYSIPAIKAKVSLYEVAAEKVQLKRAGREYLGLCPFHGERTPSFYVHPGKGLFHCYGCGAGGSVIDFYRDIHRIDDKTAIEELAARAGLMPEEEAAKIKPRQTFARPVDVSYSQEEEERRRAASIDWSRDIWRRSRPAGGSLVERYLTRRGIDVPAIGGVPTRNRPIPGTGSYDGPIANWSRCPNHPQIGCRNASCSSRRT